MYTADNITEEAICELRARAHGSHFTNRNDALIELCDTARGWQPSTEAEIASARARVAEILNAHAPSKPGKMPPQIYECGRDDCPGTTGMSHRRAECPARSVACQSEMPSAVRIAFMHIRQHHPVTLVAFDRAGRWQYMLADFGPVSFGNEIDVGILEDAAESVSSLPAIFELEEGAK